MKSYLYLAVAIIAEVIATSALKKTEQFSRLGPSLIVIAGYVISFYCLTYALEAIPVGVAYAIWSGLGIVVVTIAAAVLYGQVPDLPAAIGMALIILGVVVMNLFSKTLPH